ncbi:MULTISPECIES: hypothetical protein [Paracoccus]|nr:MULTISPECIES: hypothetical protein [Paracoccus]
MAFLLHVATMMRAGRCNVLAKRIAKRSKLHETRIDGANDARVMHGPV